MHGIRNLIVIIRIVGHVKLLRLLGSPKLLSMLCKLLQATWGSHQSPVRASRIKAAQFFKIKMMCTRTIMISAEIYVGIPPVVFQPSFHLNDLKQVVDGTPTL